MKDAPFSSPRFALLVAPQHAVIPASPWRCHNRSQTPDAWQLSQVNEFYRVSPCAVPVTACGTMDASTQIIPREHEASVHAFRRLGYRSASTVHRSCLATARVAPHRTASCRHQRCSDRFAECTFPCKYNGVVWFECVFILNEHRSRARCLISHIKPVTLVLLAASLNT